MEATFALLKPEVAQQGLIGEVLRRLEGAGLRVAEMRLLTPPRELAERHYGEEIARKHGEHVRRWLLDYICSGPVVALVLTGEEAIRLAREVGGQSPFPEDCGPGTIRGDLADDTRERAMAEQRAVRNLIHTSDSPEAARQEIALWFGEITPTP
jgi:nucleoside-diphosphate kinase